MQIINKHIKANVCVYERIERTVSYRKSKDEIGVYSNHFLPCSLWIKKQKKENFGLEMENEFNLFLYISTQRCLYIIQDVG